MEYYRTKTSQANKWYKQGSICHNVAKEKCLRWVAKCQYHQISCIRHNGTSPCDWVLMMLGRTLFAIPTFLPCYLSFQITPHCSLSLPITLPCFLPLFCVLHPKFPAHTTISCQEHPFQCYIHPRQSALSAYYPLPRTFHINCVSYNQAWTLPKVSHLHSDSKGPAP